MISNRFYPATRGVRASLVVLMMLLSVAALPALPVQATTPWLSHHPWLASCRNWLFTAIGWQQRTPPEYLQLPSDDNRTMVAAALAQSYNKIVITHQIGARYQFLPNATAHYIFEGAQRLAAAGFSGIKLYLRAELSMCSDAFCLSRALSPRYNNITLLEIATSPEFPFLDVFSMPFSTFVMWVGEPDVLDAAAIDRGDMQRQAYDLAMFLMSRFKGQDKTFLLGTWKGDWIIRDRETPTNDQRHASSPVNKTRAELFMRRTEQLQAGVDAARADMGASAAGVKVYGYIEMNIMKNASVPFTIIDDIVPRMKPVMDFVSVSFTTMPERTTSLNPAAAMYQVLDHAHSRLPAKRGLPPAAVRVFIGEFEFPRFTKQGAPEALTPTQELQAQHALAVAAAAVSWGTPHAAWWTMYDNTMTALAKTGGSPVHRGFGLVDEHNRESVLFKALQSYLAAARLWVQDRVQATGALPCRDDFRAWAASTLVTLANKAAATTAGAVDKGDAVLLPPFVQRGCEQV